MAAETPSRSTRRSAAAAAAAAAATSAAPAPDASIDSSASSGIFGGLRFYLSRDLLPERRKTVGDLIKKHGGAVLSRLEKGAVELVESKSLRVGENWVSVDFVFDSARDEVARSIHQYMAQQFGSNVATTATTEPDEQVAPKRRGRANYTAADDANMFRFLERHLGELPKSMRNVKLSMWEIAARQKATAHTASSMHEHYRKNLKKLTPAERANIFTNAEAEEKAKQRRELARANYLAQRKSAAAAASAPPPAEDDERAATATPASAAASNELSPAKTSADAQDPDATDAVRDECRDVSEQSKTPEQTKANKAPTPVHRSSPAAPSVTADAPAVFSEANFSSRWEMIVNDPSRREQLQQFFHPVRPSAAAAPETPRESAAVAVTTASGSAGGVTASRRRRRVELVAQQQQQEEEKEQEAMSAPPPKKRKARQPAAVAAAARPQAAAARATPRQPSAPKQRAQEQEDVSSESEVTHLVSQLQLETNQDADAIVHALFYSCGDVDVAKAFLRGASPSDFWSHDDDVLLEELVSEAADDVRAVTAARRRGAFAAMRVPRTAAQILTRVRYLL